MPSLIPQESDAAVRRLSMQYGYVRSNSAANSFQKIDATIRDEVAPESWLINFMIKILALINQCLNKFPIKYGSKNEYSQVRKGKNKKNAAKERDIITDWQSNYLSVRNNLNYSKKSWTGPLCQR